jgi:2-isopropylmalate synthase
VSAVEAGATHVQCTANGYGERTGNADLFVVVPNLQLKLGIECLPPGHLAETVAVSHAIAEIANIAPNTHQPYAGWASFAHKAGLHASAIKVSPELYNHIDPAIVGNEQNVLVTEMAGRASIELKAAELGHDLSGRPDLVGAVVAEVKEREAAGWTFEAADASFELLILEHEGRTLAFEVESWRTIVEQDATREVRCEATVKVVVDGQRLISTAEGNGPVNALDRALRGALVTAYPELEALHLVDYKVRILDEKSGTGARTRVLIGTSDGHDTWTTVGVHDNVIAASWHALEDAVRYGLLRHARA